MKKITNYLVFLIKGSLAARSAKASNLFTKAYKNISKVNEAIIDENNDIQKAIDKAKQKAADNNQVLKGNMRLLNKLDEFLVG